MPISGRGLCGKCYKFHKDVAKDLHKWPVTRSRHGSRTETLEDLAWLELNGVGDGEIMRRMGITEDRLERYRQFMSHEIGDKNDYYERYFAEG